MSCTGSTSTATTQATPTGTPAHESGVTSTARKQIIGPPTAAQLAQVRQWVDCATAANGDPNLGDPGTAVLSTRQAAVQYLFDGETVDSDSPVIAVEVEGNFDGGAFDRPPRGSAQPVSGVMLIIVYDLATGTGDVRLLAADQTVPDLSALGPTAQF